MIALQSCFSETNNNPSEIVYSETNRTLLNDDNSRVSEINEFIGIGQDSLLILDRSQTIYLAVKDTVVRTIGKKGNASFEYNHIRSIAKNQDTVFIVDSQAGKIIGYDLTTNQPVFTKQADWIRNIGSLARIGNSFATAKPLIHLTDQIRQGQTIPQNARTDNFLFEFSIDSLGKINKRPLIKNTSEIRLTLVQFLPLGSSFTRVFSNQDYHIFGDVILPCLWLQNKQTGDFTSVDITLESPSDETIKSISEESLRLTNKLEEEIIRKCEYIEYVNTSKDTIMVVSKFVASNEITTIRFYNFQGQILATCRIPLPKDALSFQCVSIEHGQMTFLATDKPTSMPKEYPFSFRRLSYFCKPL